MNCKCTLTGADAKQKMKTASANCSDAFRPIRVGWRAEESKDERELLDLGGARQQRAAEEELGEDAAERPQVGRRAIVAVAEEHFGGAVPAGGDVGGVALGGGGAGNAKVGELGERAVRVDENVFRFDVAVKHAFMVNIGERAQHLVPEKDVSTRKKEQKGRT